MSREFGRAVGRRVPDVIILVDILRHYVYIVDMMCFKQTTDPEERNAAATADSRILGKQN
jgi:hypothetical protein